MKIPRPRVALHVFICFLLVCAGLSAQEEPKTGREYKPREQKLLIDIPMTIAEDTLINLTGNIIWRLWGPDKEAAYFTLDSMRNNLNPKVWDMEAGQGGDTFITNQFFHPYAGGLYFASARANNFNFYWSILSSTFGSLEWEALGERDTPSSSDFINTALGGITLGEIMHRLYMELNRGGKKISATIMSPTGRITDAIRRYGPEDGPSQIRGSSLAFGFSWVNAKFFEDKYEMSVWNQGGVFINYDLVYGDPYMAHSKTPFTQFDLNTSLFVAFPLVYNFTIITNGYLASWLIADNEVNQASNGITLNFDAFITDEGTVMDLNNGRDNLSFNANSLDYSTKWRRMLNKSFEFSLKAHLGFTPWAVTDYNGGPVRDDYNLYLFGGNIKLFMELRQMKEDSRIKNGQSLALSLCFYDTWNLPKTPGFETNTFFLFSRIAYSFPLAGTFSFYLADSFLFLHSLLTRDAGLEFPDVTRWCNSAQLGVKISFL